MLIDIAIANLKLNFEKSPWQLKNLKINQNTSAGYLCKVICITVTTICLQVNKLTNLQVNKFSQVDYSNNNL